jgi:enamine deaminase RidA (YjgF/YER057c/UK114 family)
MRRTPVNPTEWGLQFSMNQGEIVEGATRLLRCSGQTSVDATPTRHPIFGDVGVSLVAAGDIRGQMTKALSNIDDILAKAGMSRSNIVFLNLFTTDMDGFLANYDVYTDWITQAGINPPQSLIGVSRLVLPDLLVEIEATAAA